MLRFEEDGMYQMPVHFGPCCGPRRGPDGERLYKKGSQESTQHMLVYETDAKAVSRYLPEGFSVRMPYIIITHKMYHGWPDMGIMLQHLMYRLLIVAQMMK